jgi:hypothetical protein
VSGSDDLIVDALRGIAEQAGAPRQTADAAWRAGRRRRLTVMGASAAGAAGAVGAAVAVLLAMAGGPVQPRHPLAAASQAVPGALVQLRSPIQFRQVAAIDRAPCTAGSGGLQGNAAPATCFHLASAGMTIIGVDSAQVAKRPGIDQYVLNIRLTPAERLPFEALTGKLAGLTSPRDQLAIIISGHVVAHPVVESAIEGGQVQIAGLGSRARAEDLLQGLLAS